MRPDSIRKFDLFYLGSIIVTAINTFAHRESLATDFTRRLTSQGDANAQLLAGSEGSVVLISIVLTALFGLLLWFLVSRQKIGVVRWIIAIYAAWQLLAVPSLLASAPSLFAIAGLLALALQLIAIFYLFKAETTIWLQGKRVVDGDGETEPLEDGSTRPE